LVRDNNREGSGLSLKSVLNWIFGVFKAGLNSTGYFRSCESFKPDKTPLFNFRKKIRFINIFWGNFSGKRRVPKIKNFKKY